MGLLDQFSNLNEDQTNGLLAAAAQMLQSSGPSLRPTNFGQVAGGGLGAFQAGSQQSKQRRLAEEEAAQVARMRGLQMQGMEGDLMDAETARRTPKKPKYSNDVKVGRGPDGKTFSYVMGDDGQPKILDGIMPRDEMKLEDLGGKKVAINPYDLQPGQEFARTQTPDSLASNQIQLRGQDITLRGQNMTDSRAREFNGIAQEGKAMKLAEKQETANMTKNSQVASFDTMLGTLDRLGKHPGLKRSVGLMSKLPTVPGTDSANFQAELDTFQSQAFIPMVAQLKGMGALSDAEGRKLTAAVGALNPNMGESAFRDSLKRITNDMEGARQRVSGERREATAAAAPKRSVMKGQVVDGYRFKGGNPADQANWEKK